MSIYTHRIQKLLILHLFTELLRKVFSSCSSTNTTEVFNNPHTLHIFWGGGSNKPEEVSLFNIFLTAICRAFILRHTSYGIVMLICIFRQLNYYQSLSTQLQWLLLWTTQKTNFCIIKTNLCFKYVPILVCSME